MALEWHGTKVSQWSEGYASDIIEAFNKDIFPYIGQQPVNEIKPLVLLNVLHRMESRGATEKAKKVRQRCSEVFRYAIVTVTVTVTVTGRAEYNPAADLTSAMSGHESKHYPFLTVEELPDFWLRTLCDVDFTPPVEGGTLETHALDFWRWLDRAAGGRPEKRDVILAALFMVLANRYDWQLFLDVTGPGGNGKSILAEIATMLAGEDNATSATIETLESPRERAALIGFSLIRLPDQEKWSGDGAGRRGCGLR